MKEMTMLRKLIAALCLSALLACPADAVTGTRRVLLSGNPFPWVLPGASVDEDFAGGRVFGCALASCFSTTRASGKTNLLPTSPSGFPYTTYGNNIASIDSNGWLIEEARTNQLLNSTAPATQTTGALAATPQTLWVNGSGSAALSNGTATGCAGTATNGSAVTFTPTAGTCTVTVTGSLNFFQLEAGAFGTSGIVTAGTTAARATETDTVIGNAQALLNGTSGQVFFNLGGTVSTTFPIALTGNLTNDMMELASSTTALTFNGSTSLTATFGSGNWAGGSKSITSWTPSGRTLVINNGTEASNAGLITTGAVTTWFFGSGIGARYLNGYIKRFTLWTGPSSAAARKAFTQ